MDLNISDVSVCKLVTDNDDDFDEDDIPAFAHPSLGTQSPGGAKGKGRAAPEQLAPPSGAGQVPQGAGLSGNIGAPPTNGGPRAARQTVGGVQVETRCVSTVSIRYFCPN